MYIHLTVYIVVVDIKWCYQSHKNWLSTVNNCRDCKTWVASVQILTLWQQATIEITWQDHSIIPCSCHIYGCYSLSTSHSWWIAHSMKCQPRGCKKSLPFYNKFLPIACSFCKGCTWHNLFTAPFCCSGKAWTVSIQSFTQWQQATIEITWWNYSIIPCSHHIYTSVILCTHPTQC